MASSSLNPFTATSSNVPSKYDVFISFRGEDTRYNFISHLHDALDRNNIETYIDYRLEKGDEVWSSLVEAIEDSALFLVIFSENYASSTWCLNELTKILECTLDQTRVVIPVFYKIDPSHVRKQTGSYQIAFANYEQSNHEQQVQKWRTALTEASNISGFHCDPERNEAAIIKEIVKCVKSTLGYLFQSENVLKGLVGIHKKIAKVESLLCKGSQDVQFIGIWGHGGIGKTTLARALFDKLCFRYEGYYFLDNVREESKKHGIIYLRNNLILTLLKDEKSHLGVLDGAISYAIRRLSRRKVLVVLDDIDDPEQLEKLVAPHWFGSGSKVIITTRDKQILSKEVDYIYEIEGLDIEEAFHLFSLKASKNMQLEFDEEARSIVKYAGGIPLALGVLDRLLYGKDKEEWKSQLEKIKKMPNPKIHDVLRLSFDGLDNEEKEIFLHIACFFKNKELEFIKSLLDACGYSTTIGLRNLADKALLTISCNKICMHDLIEEMGKEIVREESRREPGKRTRLFDSNDIFQVLKNNEGTQAIEGITLNTSKIPYLHLNPQIFSRMPKLKFLDFYTHWDILDFYTHWDESILDFYTPWDESNKLHLPYGVESLPNELRLLRWDDFPTKCLPETFSAEKLVKIEMRHSQLRTLWKGVQNLVNLKKLNLGGSKHFIDLPDFSKALHLKNVDLDCCTKLRHVHPSILSLHSLETLSLQWCKSLTCLKTNSHLRSLRDIFLDGCSKLSEFSVTSENMWNLDISENAVIYRMSSSSGSLSKIKRLILDGCTNLTCLPSELVDLRYLEDLSIKGCNELALNLCFILERLQSLITLSLDNCCDLFELPDDISLLSSLKVLRLPGTNVDSLPVSIKHLSRLRTICLNDCKGLRSLPELPHSIETLEALNCTSLETLHLTSIPAAISAVENFGISLCFQNCVKLDEQSIKAIAAKVTAESFLRQRFIGVYQAKYPGSKVPEFFMYRSTELWIGVDLSSIPRSKDWNFIFCVVVSRCPPESLIEVKWGINDGSTVCNFIFSRPLFVNSIDSDHVCVWYDPRLPGEVQRKIEESRANDGSTIVLKVEFSRGGGIEGMKEFGVCPTYALGFETYIKQTELLLEPSSIGMEVGCSYDNSYEKQTIPQKRKYQWHVGIGNKTKIKRLRK